MSFPHKVAYGIGGFVNNLLAQGIGNMMIVLNLALGMDFRAVGLLGALPRAFDAITDPLVGFASDKTKSRWGRRRPFLFVGAIAAGVVFALLWRMPAPTQFRIKLVDYGADGVYGGEETGGPDGLLESIGKMLKGVVTVEVTDDVEDEVTILPPTLVTGAWVSVDVPLTDFDQLATREHLSQIIISGDLSEVYVDNVHLYRSDDTSRAGPAGRDVEGAAAPPTAAPAPSASPEDVISFFGDAYENVPVQFWSTAWDRAEVADARVAGGTVKHYTDMRFAAIDFGGTPVDARAMTHVRMDIWTPEPTGEGWGQRSYFWYFLIGSLVFFLAYTIFATPWVALGYELTPDYNERTRLMGVQNFVANIAFIVGPWFLVIMTNPEWFRNQMAGARFLALAICVTTIALGVVPAVFLRERVPAGAGDTGGGSFGESALEFLRGLWRTIRTGPFLVLCVATFLIFNSFIMISNFQFWVFAYHVAGGNVAEGAGLAGLVGTLGIFVTLLVIVIVTWLGTKIGKKNAFFVSTGVSMFGYALKWFCYTPEHPMLALLPAPFLAFGLGGLFTLMGSMIADVVDLDELSTGERREGMFGSIFWWVVKVGQSGAILAGGFLLHSTGLDPALGADQPDGTIFRLRLYDAVVPLIASAIAIAAMYLYPITETRARRVRAELERRRGAGPG